MKSFDIYMNLESPGRMEAVKRGFSWPAFFLPTIWAFSKGLILTGLAMLALTIFFNVLGGKNPAFAALGILANVIIAFCANNWVRNKLGESGYSLVTTVEAAGAISAIRSAMGIQEATEKESLLEALEKTCPSCSQTIKLEAKKCRFCNERFDPDAVAQHIALAKNEINENRRVEEGQKRCPKCQSEDVKSGAYIEDGSIGDWCPHCQMSLQKIKKEINEDRQVEEGQKRCPKCQSEDVRSGAYIEDGSIGDWCPHCQMSLQKMKADNLREPFSADRTQAMKCPTCAEFIDRNSVRCEYCNEEVTEQRSELGEKQCPTCKSWDIRKGAYIEDGGIGDWCPHCRKSLKEMQRSAL